MERLTRPDLNVDPGTERFLSAKLGGKEIDWKQNRDTTLNVLINGPTSNGFCKDIFRKMVRDLYERLKAYEDTGLTPERCAEFARADAEGRYIVMRDAEQEGVARLRELSEADKDGRLVVLPCKVGERWVDEDGRAVRITAVIVSMEPFGENINIYFDYEDATPDDAGSDCVTNWYHFRRLFTCAETVLDNRKDADNA